MNTNVPFAILSAFREDRDAAENAEADVRLFDQLTALEFRPVTVAGFFQGVPEQSYLVFLPGGDSADGRYEELTDIARSYDQDYVLYVDADRMAYLDNLRTRTPDLVGRWREIPPDAKRLPDSYTIGPDGRRWEVIR